MREMQPSCTPRDARTDPMRTAWLRVLPQGSARKEQVAKRLMIIVAVLAHASPKEPK